MRRLLITTALPLLLLGCSPGAQQEVRVAIKSDKVLSVKNFEYTPATAYSPCNLSGVIEYDVSIEPSNFTGYVQLKDAVIQYGGTWKKVGDTVLAFVDGKQVDGTNIYQYPLEESSTAEKQATCASKSSSDIKLISLGKPMFALHGAKVIIQANK